jgi:drug/metabolite transporter (DMT)-like permease
VPRIAAFKTFLAVVFWGASFVATKAILRQASPITIVVVRFALGLVVLSALVYVRRSYPAIPRRDQRWLLLLGFNGIFVHQMLQANGLVTTSATNTGWIVALTPIFTALLAWLWLRETFGRVKLLGLALALIGTALVVSRGRLGAGAIGLPATWGDLLVLLSAPNWAIFSVLSKRLLTRYPPVFVVTAIMGMGWLMLLPFFVGSAGWQELSGLGGSEWAGLLFLGICCSGLAYVFWYDALQVAPAGQVAAFLYLEPLVTVGVAALALGERPTLATLMGGGFILAGVWLVNRR